jgi:hypothetical protein
MYLYSLQIKGDSKKNVSNFSTEDGNKSSLQNTLFFRIQMMQRVQSLELQVLQTSSKHLVMEEENKFHKYLDHTEDSKEVAWKRP